MENTKTAPIIESFFYFEDKLYGNCFESDMEIIESIRNLDPNSEFGRKMNHLTQASNGEILEYLKNLPQENYEAMFLRNGQGNIGHAAYQVHDKDMKVFEYFVNDDFRERGYAHKLNDALIIRGKQSNLERIKVGKPDSEEVTKAIMKRVEMLGEYPVDMENHWIYLNSSEAA